MWCTKPGPLLGLSQAKVEAVAGAGRSVARPKCVGFGFALSPVYSLTCPRDAVVQLRARGLGQTLLGIAKLPEQ